MNSLLFTPVIGDVAAAKTESTAVEDSPGTPASYALRLPADGRLRATRLDWGIERVLEDCGTDLIAFVRRCGNSREAAWVMVVRSSDVTLNGVGPPLPAAVLEPGGLLAVGDRYWLISSLWKPELESASDELRDKPCPVCGLELRLAPVVQCGCGRWTHLENPSVPNDPNALNCYLASGTCGGCHRVASLEPQEFPALSDRFACALPDEYDFDLH